MISAIQDYFRALQKMVTSLSKMVKAYLRQKIPKVSTKVTVQPKPNDRDIVSDLVSSDNPSPQPGIHNRKDVQQEKGPGGSVYQEQYYYPKVTQHFPMVRHYFPKTIHKSHKVNHRILKSGARLGGNKIGRAHV